MEINRHHLQSPVQIITTYLGIPEEYKKKCIKEIYKIGDKQNQKTNVKGIMSSYHIYTETRELDDLLNNIINSINISVPIEDKRFYYDLKNCWGAVYKEGHYTVPHVHLPDNISFVYYLKANENSSPLVFDECNFKINPIDDFLIIFPSYVTHSVPKQSKGEDRICIAGNLKIKLKKEKINISYEENKNSR